jgi:hypothetical protein
MFKIALVISNEEGLSILCSRHTMKLEIYFITTTMKNQILIAIITIKETYVENGLNNFLQ